MIYIIIIVLIWAAIKLKKELTPPPPPIEDMDEHLRHIISLPDQKSRRKYINNRKPGDK